MFGIDRPACARNPLITMAAGLSAWTYSFPPHW